MEGWLCNWGGENLEIGQGEGLALLGEGAMLVAVGAVEKGNEGRRGRGERAVGA